MALAIENNAKNYTPKSLAIIIYLLPRDVIILCL